jgi:histidinol-phosphate/aromatic aminotransferase/cobyric acid decarboxylase-like protein
MKTKRAPRLTISLAESGDMRAVYELRHEVYAAEIEQYASNPEGILPDNPDIRCTYVTATVDGKLVGMAGITSPSSPQYSVDQFLAREEIPYAFDETLYEIRALTVKQSLRGFKIAGALMYGAFRHIEACGGKYIISIGRLEMLEMYLRLGMVELGPKFACGNVQFHLIGADLERIKGHLNPYASALGRLEQLVDWNMDIPFREAGKCFHGGAFFDAIGPRFDRLAQKDETISADVLDAWFPPPPETQAQLREHLPWAMKTSPPTAAEGLEQIIAETRGVQPTNILTGAGSSSLIFLAFRHWLDASAKVLILDPTYGEYEHVLEQVVGAKVERFTLDGRDGFKIDLERFRKKVAEGFDLVVWVNPNSPTGRHVSKSDVESVLREAAACKRIWIDETYVEYAGAGHSMEKFAAHSENVIVCKSMSKVYSLSGMRVAYLCAAPAHLEDLRVITPPWSVSLPAQMAAVSALQSSDYYSARYNETHQLRENLRKGLISLGIREVVPGIANFLLFQIPETGPSARTLIKNCRTHGLYLRNATGMGTRMGSRAVRIAVKDADTNQRMLEILKDQLQG